MVDVKSWMDQVRLKMNPSKTAFIYFGSRTQLSRCVVTQLNANGELVERATLIKYLGAWLDAQLSFKEHIIKKCQTAIINYLCIRHICHLITDSACETLDKFQRIQNMCAPKDPASHNASKIPICQRIEFKILTLIYKCLNKQAPEYLQNLLVEIPSQRCGLRSELTYKELLIPFMKRKTFAEKSFSAATSTLWNKLPLKIKQASTLNQFKSLLKTYLFQNF